MALMDEIAADGAFTEFFNMKVGDKKKIRFLLDGNDGVQANVHERWTPDNPDDPRGKGHWEYKTLCRKHFEKPCPFCEREVQEGKTYIVRYYGWMVYNHTDSRVQIFMYKKNRTTPIEQISEQWGIRGNLVDRDYWLLLKGSDKDPDNRTQWQWIVSNEDKDEPGKKFTRSAYGIKLPEIDGSLDIEKVHADMFRKISGIFTLDAPVKKNGDQPKPDANPVQDREPALPRASKNSANSMKPQRYNLDDLDKELGLETESGK